MNFLVKAFALIFLTFLSAILFKLNSNHLVKKNDEAVVGFICKSVESRAQLGANREVIEFLKSSISSYSLKQKPRLEVFEGNKEIIRSKSFETNHDFWKYQCSILGNTSLKIVFYFEYRPIFDKDYLLSIIGFGLLYILAFFAFYRIQIASKIFLINAIESSVAKSIKLKSPVQANSLISRIISKTFDLEVPVLVRINEYIKYQKEVIQSQVKVLAESEKQAAVGKAVQNIAHDFKNPINVIQLYSNCKDWKQYLENKSKIDSELSKLISMVGALSRAELGAIVSTDWCKLNLEEIIASIKPITDSKNIQLNFSPQSNDLLKIDLDKIERSLLNLISNAIEAGAKTIDIETITVGRNLTLKVTDDGPGIPKEIVSSIFDRGVTFGKRNGSGLGLAFVNETAMGHGGYVNYNRVSNLSVFTIYLPKALKNSEINENLKIEHMQRSEHIESAPLEQIKKDSILLILSSKERENYISQYIANKHKIHVSNKECDLSSSTYFFTDDDAFLEKAIDMGVPVFNLDMDDSTEEVIQYITETMRGSHA